MEGTKRKQNPVESGPPSSVWEGTPPPIHNANFFKETSSVVKWSATVAQIGNNDPFPQMYEDFLWHQPLTPEIRSTCLRNIGNLCLEERKRNREFKTSQWLDFKSTDYVLLSDFGDLLPTCVAKQKALGMATAYRHLLSLVRAKLWHAKSEQEVDDHTCSEISRQIHGKSQKLKEVTARFQGPGAATADPTVVPDRNVTEGGGDASSEDLLDGFVASADTYNATSSSEDWLEAAEAASMAALPEFLPSPKVEGKSNEAQSTPLSGSGGFSQYFESDDWPQDFAGNDDSLQKL